MCQRHESFERHCADCIIESLYGITILSTHEVMDVGIINVFVNEVNSTLVTFNT